MLRHSQVRLVSDGISSSPTQALEVENFLRFACLARSGYHCRARQSKCDLTPFEECGPICTRIRSFHYVLNKRNLRAAGQAFDARTGFLNVDRKECKAASRDVCEPIPLKFPLEFECVVGISSQTMRKLDAPSLSCKQTFGPAEQHNMELRKGRDCSQTTIDKGGFATATRLEVQDFGGAGNGTTSSPRKESGKYPAFPKMAMLSRAKTARVNDAEAAILKPFSRSKCGICLGPWGSCQALNYTSYHRLAICSCQCKQGHAMPKTNP